MRVKRGFTLIELLVVIAIIALLLSIMMPALSMVKEKARLVVCGSNQKQLIYGVSMYGTEHDGKLPPNPNWVGGNNYHRPTELNWYGNGVGTLDPTLSNYHPVGKYLGGYLPDVGVYNCTVAPIAKDTPWPPRGSKVESVGTYNEVYQDYDFAPLHATYMLLWNYQGYNQSVSTGGAQGENFVAPSKMSSKNQLILQDSLFYLPQGQGNLLWETPSNSWYSSHNFGGATKVDPYFVMDGPQDEIPDEIDINAGYLDGSVQRFKSSECYWVKNWSAAAGLVPVF
ncbi:putative major pilin subunit [Anaerohalosphaera lusitana]|uniref:Putative major pilin subunit n=1 Tax=Anaerohalosphaera lusitana TaxID=1936003 RepID=A0A1U9NNI9_9BACT|nr:type II secretion system protein [Anaerohalosphaera lusitana]AQT69304.1 putative major pilin subunit [Anaerohalosphaera lusitana]